MTKENEEFWEIIACVSEGSDVEMEQMLQTYLTAARGVTGWDQGQEGIMACRIRWAVEARREGRGTEGEQLEEMGEQSTDEQDETSGFVEVIEVSSETA